MKDKSKINIILIRENLIDRQVTSDIMYDKICQAFFKNGFENFAFVNINDDFELFKNRDIIIGFYKSCSMLPGLSSFVKKIGINDSNDKADYKRINSDDLLDVSNDMIKDLITELLTYSEIGHKQILYCDNPDADEPILFDSKTHLYAINISNLDYTKLKVNIDIRDSWKYLTPIPLENRLLKLPKQFRNE